ncbi:hypothetical protein [Actinoplanes sp. NPDC051859]|uniref:hypothetical protein n=1 Tax=Actinoplanes sp. NPDC051859 TaxID=3363909 RepID=UPI00378E7C8D
MGEDEQVRVVVDELVAVKPALAAGNVRPYSLLTHDLAFDPGEVAELADRFRTGYPGFDLSAWLAHARTSHGDSVGAMARVLAVLRP